MWREWAFPRQLLGLLLAPLGDRFFVLLRSNLGVLVQLLMVRGAVVPSPEHVLNTLHMAIGWLGRALFELVIRH